MFTYADKWSFSKAAKNSLHQPLASIRDLENCVRSLNSNTEANQLMTVMIFKYAKRA